jgi:cardiolipin synthase
VTGKSLLEQVPNVGTINPATQTDADALIQIVASGPNHEIAAHFEILMKLIVEAKTRIWLSSPYFVPPKELLDQLRTAALSGIDVRLVLPGISDKGLLLGVSERYANRLFATGVKIYSMYGTFNHTKAYLIDDSISFIGSSNLDYRAFFADQQTMGLIYDHKFNQELTKRFE